MADPTRSAPKRSEGRTIVFNRIALWTPYVLFAGLYFLPWNPIYPAILCLAIGSIASSLCRPDLTARSVVGGAVFLGLYTIFMLGLVWLAPGYIAQVWNLPALGGVLWGGIPLEEWLHLWLVLGSVYEHFTWSTRTHTGRRDIDRRRSSARATRKSEAHTAFRWTNPT